ncbi:unnamed protein product [Didymodactylos carnosus]|uniref:Uncharacterized protein n=1 Tax=Didymodactylos carnosus TaxID=1234261 RepID=A0A8S2UVH6_9BILA|nr:unnamed protein product [Didymodactylos carnosus]CAF4351955.1 unnamed protein product [Didymodactylos carnosus]
MDSILKIFCRQIEDLLRLTHMVVRALQLQSFLSADQNLSVTFDISNENCVDYQCSLSYDFCNEVKFAHQRLQHTCYLLQRAIYRVQAMRQAKPLCLIQIHDDTIVQYDHFLSKEFNYIQTTIQNSKKYLHNLLQPLKTLQLIYNQIEQNIEVLLCCTHWSLPYKNTMFFAPLVSDILSHFFLILTIVSRLSLDIVDLKPCKQPTNLTLKLSSSSQCILSTRAYTLRYTNNNTKSQEHVTSLFSNLDFSKNVTKSVKKNKNNNGKKQ